MKDICKHDYKPCLEKSDTIFCSRCGERWTKEEWVKLIPYPVYPYIPPIIYPVYVPQPIYNPPYVTWTTAGNTNQLPSHTYTSGWVGVSS